MNVDIEVYLSGVIKFFKENPKDLLNLIPKDKEQDFYKMMRESSVENHEKGEDYVLTKKQIIDICVELNGVKKKDVPKNINTIEELTNKLNIAVDNEDYEEAAKIRDQIKEINEKENN